MKILTYEQALLRATSLCSSSEYSPRDIQEKLTRWGISSADADRIIDYLTTENYLNKERFCRAFALDKFRYNHWGRIKIAQALRLQGMDANEIQEGMSHIDSFEYYASIDDAIRKKDRTLHDEDAYTRRGKIVRHLISRGFEMDKVLKRLDQYIPE